MGLRVMAGLVLAMVGGMLVPVAAIGSCAPPVSVAEYAQRADAVVYGRVLSLEGGAPFGPPGRVAKLEVVQVLKGSVPAGILVSLGPEADGEGGGVVATSVDYQAGPGTDHTLYLRAGGDGRYVTDACSGTHPGGPTPEETAYFGGGAAPEPGTAGASGVETSALVGLALVAALAVLAGAYALRLSRRRATTTLG